MPSPNSPTPKGHNRNVGSDLGGNVGFAKSSPLAFVYIREEIVSTSFCKALIHHPCKWPVKSHLDGSREKKVVKPSSSEVEQYAECGVSANTRTTVR